MRRPTILAFAILASLALAQPRNETAVVAVSVDATALDPWLSTNITDKNAVSHLYDTLLKRDQDMTIQPNVATSFEALDDDTWEFRLRDDVVFSNGEPLTAEDVAFTVEHFRDPALNAPSIAQFNLIESVEVVDSSTVRIHTSEPFPALPAVLTEFWIVPDEYTRENGVMSLAQQPVGSGPYTLTEWTRDSSILFEANGDWWAGAPEIGFVEFRVVPDQNARIAQIQTGEADLVAQVPTEAAPLLERNNRVKLLEASGPRAYFLGFNQRLETPLLDVKVRQAINHAINVQEIVDVIFEGRGRPLATLLTPEQFGYDPSIEPFGYDPERARELLAEAGYGDGFEIDMESPTARYPKDAEVAQIIASQLGQVGITVNLDIQEWGGYVGQFRNEDGPPIYLLGWSIPTFDPDAILTPLLTDGVTYSRFVDSELATMIDEARSTVDDQARAQLYSQIQERMKELAPMAFLYQLNELYGVSDRLEWEPRADERIYLWNASLGE
jgi:peptide/nickel transport system substrate-binding protein